MKILVTGAGGFVGAAVVRKAVCRGHEVFGTIRPGSSDSRLIDSASHFQLVTADLRNQSRVSAIMRDLRPDTIVHVAWSGVSNRDRLDRLQITDNIETSCHLLEAGVEAGASRFVGLGSQGEYGPFDRRITEQDLPQPTTLYGASKLAVYYLTRQLAAQAGISHAWMRLFSAYGPRDNSVWLIPSLIQEMLAGRRPKTTLGEQSWDYLFIDDIADAILAVATSNRVAGIFNLGSGQPIRVRSIIEKIRDLVAPQIELVFGEIPYRPDQVWHMEADISRLKSEAGWAPRIDIDFGLAATVQWFRELNSRTNDSRG